MPGMKILSILLALCLSLAASAQNSAEYRVEKGEKDFVLLQNGQYVVFDTLQVQTNLAQKTGEVSDLETEIALLERLILQNERLGPRPKTSGRPGPEPHLGGQGREEGRTSLRVAGAEGGEGPWVRGIGQSRQLRGEGLGLLGDEVTGPRGGHRPRLAGR